MLVPFLFFSVRSAVVGFAYPSYSCYCALQRNATVTELVSRLTSWALVGGVALLCTYILDPVLGFWFPLYYPAKVALVAWLAFPQTQGADLVLSKYVEPGLFKMEDYIQRIASSLQRQPSVFKAGKFPVVNSRTSN